MTIIQPKRIIAADLSVGTPVTTFGARWGEPKFEDTKVARITSTTVVLENGKVFNIESGRYVYGPAKVKHGERKTKNNQFPDEGAWIMYSDDPWVAQRKASMAHHAKAEMLQTEARSACHAFLNMQYSGTVQNAEAAIAALQAYVAFQQEN